MAGHYLYKTLMFTWNNLPFRREVALTMKQLGIPVGKLYCDLWFEGFFKVNVKGGSFLLSNYQATTIENSIFWRGFENTWEPNSISLWRALVEKSDVVFDVGANTGIYSLYTKAVKPSCQVYAFEPARRTYKKLTTNIEKNGFDVKAFPLAVSNVSAQLTFYDYDTLHQYSASLNPEMSKFSTNPVSYPVEAKTLKAFIEEHNIQKLDAIKIDVEMHEPEALEGLGEYLYKFSPAILIEVLTDEIAMRIEPFFKGRDFLFYSISEEHGKQPILVEHMLKSPSRNYLICTKAKAQELGLQTK